MIRTQFRHLDSILVSLLLMTAAWAAPTAVDDSFSVNEDSVLTIAVSNLIDADFDGGGGGGAVVPFSGDWDYLDSVENENGNQDDYPTDGAGRAWNDPDFDVTSSNIAPWSSGALPLQSGGVDAFPGAPDQLGGIAVGGNTVTTYLFRNQFSLTADQADNDGWSVNLAVDDSCVIYINGTEVLRNRLDPGPLTPQTFGFNNPNEAQYESLALDIPDGLLVEGTNSMAIEVHQGTITSSDVGLDVELVEGASEGPTAGFVYQDDVFGTSTADFSDGQHLPAGGFNGTGGLQVHTGGDPPGSASSSGAWVRPFTLSADATVEFSLRYRLVANSGFENDEFATALAEIDGIRIGNATGDSLFYIGGNGNGGGDDDSGWLQESFTIPLSAGTHALGLGAFVNKSTVASEVADAYFDDVVIAVAGGGGGNGGVLANDSGDASLSAEILTQPSSGMVSLLADGTFTYTPDADFFGVDTFTYRANDGTGSSAPATVSITVDAVNDAPTAAEQSYTTAEDQALTVPVADGLLRGATDVDNAAGELVALLETDVAEGSLVVSPSGVFTYSPRSDFSGVDTFTYRVSDGVAQSEPQTVSITIIPADDPPTAVADHYSIDEDQLLEVSVASGAGDNLIPLIAEGSVWRYLDDGSDQGVSWISTTYNDDSWASGAAQLGYGDGDEVTEVGYGPDEDNKFATTYFRRWFNVDDVDVVGTLQLRLIRDDAAAVYLNGIEIVRSNLAEEAAFDTRALTSTGNENGWRDFDIDPGLLEEGLNLIAVEVHQHDPDSSDLSFDLSLTGIQAVIRGVLANDVDPEGTALTAAVESQPEHGSLSLNADGTFTYQPEANYFGDDEFQYRVFSGGLSSVGTATITVIPGPNVAPVGVADSYGLSEDGGLTVGVAEGVLENDNDADGDVITAELVSAPDHGSLTLAPDGSFSYVPEPDFFGADRFSYRVSDRQVLSGETEVTLMVANVNDPPEVNPDTFVIQPGQVFAGNVLANDFDADNDVLGVTLLGAGGSGTLELANDGSFTFDPGDFEGTEIFFYQANDAVSSSGDAQVILVVNGRPEGMVDGYTVIEDGSLEVPAPQGLLANDSDPEGGSLAAQLAANVSNGTLALAADGSFSYTPEPDFFGADSFSYLLTDGFQQVGPVLVTIDVQAVNDEPVAEDDHYGVVTNETFSVGVSGGVLDNDSDVDGDNLEVTLLTDVASGTLSLAPDGAFSYTPAADFEGEDSFTYRVADASSSTSATAFLYVGPDIKTVVINEIMYHPASDNDLEEYIEITNIGANPVNLTGWSFGSGVDFTFPSVVLMPAEFLVIAADVASFEASYGVVDHLIGGWDGRLSNSGERLRLFDASGAEVDDLRYADQGEWAARQRIDEVRGWDWNKDHDGGGQSLELILPTISNKHGQNWAASQGAPTPGAANSVAQPDVAPLILDVAHAPIVPRSNEPVTITARLLDEDGTSFSAALFWREAVRDPGPFAGVAMADDGRSGDGDAGDGVFGAVLPAMPDRTVVEFYVSAGDGASTRTWPAATNLGQVANAHYQVDDEVHSGDWPIYRIIMTGDEDRNFVNVNRSSNERFHTTLVLDDCSGPVIRYNSSIRVRGAGSRSHNPPPMRVSVPRDNLWNDRSAMNWNTKFTYSQYIGMRLFQGAGLAAPDGKPMHVRWNGEDRLRDDAFDYGLAVHMEVLDGDYADDKYPEDPRGNLYKKVRPDREWAWRDGDVDRYIADGWGKETNADENDWTDLDQWLGVMNNAPGEPDYIAQVESVVDLDQWMMWFAAMAVIANGETNASNGADDDFSMYRGVLDPRFQMVPHDLDTILGNGDGSRITDPEHTIFDMISRGNVLDPLVPLFSDPSVLTRYYQALRELLQGNFAKEEFDELVDNSLAGWVPQDQIDDIKSFMDARRIFITGLVDAELGPPGPAPVATTSPTVVSGHGELMISEVLASNTLLQLAGTFPDMVELFNSGGSTVDLSGLTMSDDPEEPGKFVFPPGSTLAAGAYMLLFGASDPETPGLHLGFGLGANGDSIYLFDGGSVVDSVSFGLQIPNLSIGRTGAGLDTWALGQVTPGSANVTQPLGDPNGLRINEWLTQPELVFERDFIEVYNPSALPVAIGGMGISDEPATDLQRYQMPALSFVPAGGFTVFSAIGDDASAGNALELPFKLGSDQGWLAISGTNGVEIDEVHYLCHRHDVSQGRAVDGGPAYEDFILPSPGISNEANLANEEAIITGLRITELMYHPESGNLEYVELRNIGEVELELGGIAFTDGIDFTFPPMALPAGDYVLVVQDAGAFQLAYGTGPNVAGTYSGKLSNGGEQVRLEIPFLGAGIHDFEYDDGWFPLTDGGGFALEIIDPSAPPSTWDSRSSWRSGSVAGGTPGSGGIDPAAYDRWVTEQFGSPVEGQSGELDDPDLDGVKNLLEFALGGDPQASDLGDLLEFSSENGFLTLTFRRSVASIGLVELVPQISSDGQNWISGGGVTVEDLLETDGILETWRVRDATPIGVGGRRFLRLRASWPDDA